MQKANEFWLKVGENVASKKLWLISAATWLMHTGKLSEDTWLILALVYMGAEVTHKLGEIKFNNKPKGGE